MNYKSKVLYFAAAASIPLSDSEEDRVGPEVVEGEEENNVDVNNESSEEAGSMKRKYQSPVWEIIGQKPKQLRKTLKTRGLKRMVGSFVLILSFPGPHSCQKR